MSNIHSIGSNLLRAYVSFQANPDSMDADKTKKIEEEMDMDDDTEATPQQKVDKYIVEQSTDVSEEIKRLIEEMKKQQEKLLALGQAGESSKFQAELEQKSELATNRAQNESDFVDKLTKEDLTNVLKQVLSDDSENADEANIDLVAQLTNMIAAKSSPTTVEAEA